MADRVITRIAVVVPARDEEEQIGYALAAIRTAAERVPTVRVEMVVVANGCTDRTESVARGHGAHVLVREKPNVGAARAAGFLWAMRDGSAGLWIATTDADSIVPIDWLAEQIRAAEHGAEAFLGTVALASADADRHARWVDLYAGGVTNLQAHRHVHGANLGVLASMYSAVGGFQPLPSHEDVDLAARLEAIGAVVARVGKVPVRTSARHDPRAAGGVGDDLAASG